MPYIRTCVAFLSGIVLFGCGSVFAAENSGIVLHALPSTLEHQEMQIITVNLAPGQSSSPHRHNAHVFVYVLEGNVEMQVRGGPIVSLQPGDTFYESPDDIHQVSRNASNTATAKFVVHMLKTVGEPVTVPVE